LEVDSFETIRIVEPAEGGIYVVSIKFNPVANSSGPLSSDERRPAADKRIQHNVAPRRTVHDRVCH
jgi:hypothetical protein